MSEETRDTGSSNSTVRVRDGEVVLTTEDAEAVRQLLAETLENLRLMRQLDRLSDAERSRVIVKGYELFDRAADLGVVPDTEEGDDG